MNTRRVLGAGLGILTVASVVIVGEIGSRGRVLQADQPLGQGVSLRRGEADVIRRRTDWFFRPRLPGSDGRMAEKREMATRQAELMMQSPGDVDAAPWQAKGPFSSTFDSYRFGIVSGRITCLAKDFAGNALYAGGASGGLWKSTNDGASWTPLFDRTGTQTIGAIALDPNNAKTIWVGTGENVMPCEEYFGIGLLRSRDGGTTWERRNGAGANTLMSLSTYSSIIVDPRDSNHIIVAGSVRGCAKDQYLPGGLFTSTDGGSSWIARLINKSVMRIAMDPKSPSVLWAGSFDDGVYRSTDGGNEWARVPGLPSGQVGRVDVVVAPSDNRTMYALFGAVGGETPQFWRSADGGTSWQLMSQGTVACDGQCWYNMFLAVDPANPLVIYRGTILLYKSNDGGRTWKNLTRQWGLSQKVHQDMHALLLDPQNPQTIYVGSDGGIWKTSDVGSHFRNLNSNLSLTQFYDIGVHPTDKEIIIGGSQDNSSLVRTRSDRWALLEFTGDGFVSMFDPSDPNFVYTASYPWQYTYILRSKSGIGGPFRWITGPGSGIGGADRIGWVTPYAVDRADPARVFLGTHRLYRSLDRGNTWTPVGPPDMTSAGEFDNVAAIEVASADGSYVYAGTTDGRIWRSTDHGENWFEISSGLPTRAVNDIAADPSDPAKAVCVVSGFGTSHLYEFDGTAWSARGSGLPDVPANTCLMLSATTLVVGTDVGVFESTNRGTSFARFDSGLPAGLVVTDIEYSASTKTLTAGTYGRGAWQRSLGSSRLWTGRRRSRTCGGATLLCEAAWTSRASTSGVIALPTNRWLCARSCKCLVAPSESASPAELLGQKARLRRPGRARRSRAACQTPTQLDRAAWLRPRQVWRSAGDAALVAPPPFGGGREGGLVLL
ncbi:MAG: hypothetical protein HYX75_23325 [Acidobacteria bacterium]|nr:hypothetical protein [Acidobacteriota bacterium]